MLQQGGQTRAACCAQQCCDLLRSNVTIHLRRPWTSAFFRLASGTVGFSPRLKNFGHMINIQWTKFDRKSIVTFISEELP